MVTKGYRCDFLDVEDFIPI